jgi:hypothetical protein
MRTSATWARWFALALLPTLIACSSTKGVQDSSPTNPRSKDNVQSFVSQPLADLNISSEEIAPILTEAAANPYAPPKAADCDTLGAEIAQLDAVLGPDLAPVKPGEQAAIISTDNAGSLAWSAARSTANGFIPFRSVIRFITGAERHDARVATAILAGFVRRAYLRGMAADMNCPQTPPQSEAVAKPSGGSPGR